MVMINDVTILQSRTCCTDLTRPIANEATNTMTSSTSSCASTSFAPCLALAHTHTHTHTPRSTSCFGHSVRVLGCVPPRPIESDLLKSSAARLHTRCRHLHGRFDRSKLLSNMTQPPPQQSTQPWYNASHDSPSSLSPSRSYRRCAPISLECCSQCSRFAASTRTASRPWCRWSSRRRHRRRLVQPRWLPSSYSHMVQRRRCACWAAYSVAITHTHSCMRPLVLHRDGAVTGNSHSMAGAYFAAPRTNREGEDDDAGPP